MATDNNLSRKDSLSLNRKHNANQQSPGDSTAADGSPPPTTSFFRYERLEDPTKQIRLCRILPGSLSPQLAVRLETHTLNKDVVPFSALSYAWGKSASDKLIFLDDVPVPGSLDALTQNLYTFLSRLRAIGFEERLWVDALCIDQQNKIEKEAQVALMSSLFERAKDVIILLDEGCSCPHQAKADHSLIKDSIDQLARNAHFFELDCYSARRKVDPECTKIISVASRLLASAWFTRVWTVQENVLSKQSYVLLADGLFPWETFEKASQYWNAHLKADCCADIVEILDGRFKEALHQIYTHISAIKHIRARLPEGPSILEAMLCFQHLLAKLPRDKFNGFRGLHRASSELLPPDYTKSDAEVYEAMTIWFLENEADLVALALNLHDESASLPSWVLDLSIAPKLNTNYWRAQVELYSAYDCSLQLGCSFKYEPPGRLRMTAIEIDRISAIGKGMFIEDMKTEDYLKVLKNWSAFAGGQTPLGVDGNVFSDEFCATVLGGRVKDPYPLRKANKRDYAQWCHAVSEMTQDQSVGTKYDIVMSSHFNAVMRRVLFKTDRGSLGLGYPSMQAGDIVWLYGDGRAPFVTRRLPVPNTQEPQHQLLGYCYHQKLMEGHLDISAISNQVTTCVLAGGKDASQHQHEGHRHLP